ncbi:MAG: SIS domain-containing protein [Eubacteriales bacterium]|nr:SIS domain-containing protein [Eubacteriales bacterium]
MKNKSLTAAIKSLKIESKAIGDMAEYLDRDAFARAVDVLANARLIMTCASGSSGIAAKKFAHSLCCIGKSAMFIPPCEAVHGGLGALKKGDVTVIVSKGGKTTELLPVIDACRKIGAMLLAVTENPASYLALHADLLLKLKVERESDGLGLMATASFAATIGIFDALLAALIEETDFSPEQFALIHPGGAVGETLNALGVSFK